jgi:hypothetical protein
MSKPKPVEVRTNKRAYTVIDPGPGKCVVWEKGEKVISIQPVGKKNGKS